MSLRPTWWSVTGVRTPHRRPDARRLIGTMPHKHTIPAPGAAVELAEPVTLALTARRHPSPPPTPCGPARARTGPRTGRRGADRLPGGLESVGLLERSVKITACRSSSIRRGWDFLVITTPRAASGRCPRYDAGGGHGSDARSAASHSRVAASSSRRSSPRSPESPSTAACRSGSARDTGEAGIGRRWGSGAAHRAILPTDRAAGPTFLRVRHSQKQAAPGARERCQPPRRSRRTGLGAAWDGRPRVADPRLTRTVTEVTTCRDPHRAYAIVLARVLGTVIGRPRYFRYLAGQRPGALDAKGPR